MTCISTSVPEYLLAGKPSARVALRFLGTDCTYGFLEIRSAQIAAGLLSFGLGKGERAILLGDNTPFWVESYLGILRAGLVCVPLAGNTQPREVDRVLRSTEAKIVFVQASALRVLGPTLTGATIVVDTCVHAGDVHPSMYTSDELCIRGQGISSLLPIIEADDLAALMFTSGSTGFPRGVMVSHANIVSNTESIIKCLALTQLDRILVVLPFHYCYGASLLHTHLRVGGELVVDSRFMFPETVLERMADYACTGFAGVPSHFQILLRKSTLRQRRFPHLRYVQQAGGALAPAFVQELRSALPTSQIFIMYGQTEATARLSYLPPCLLDSKCGSIGKGIPGVHLRVVNEAGENVRPGEIGEIVASGQSVTKGYWRDPEASAKCFRGGSLYTGDLAVVDPDGFIYIVGRSKDIVKCRGERVSCREIEEQLLEFEELVEAAVIGIPDDVLGEAVKAFVVPRSRKAINVSERLLLYCKGRMAPQYVPKEIVVMPHLPKNDSGKILRQALRAL